VEFADAKFVAAGVAIEGFGVDNADGMVVALPLLDCFDGGSDEDCADVELCGIVVKVAAVLLLRLTGAGVAFSALALVPATDCASCCGFSGKGSGGAVLPPASWTTLFEHDFGEANVPCTVALFWAKGGGAVVVVAIVAVPVVAVCVAAGVDALLFADDFATVLVVVALCCVVVAVVAGGCGSCATAATSTDVAPPGPAATGFVPVNVVPFAVVTDATTDGWAPHQLLVLLRRLCSGGTAAFAVPVRGATANDDDDDDDDCGCLVVLLVVALCDFDAVVVVVTLLLL
jgi:hypothetical protein